MPNATSYCVAFVDAVQLSVGVNDTPVALLAGVGPAGAAGTDRVVKLQTEPLVDPPVPLAM
ncbi:MAG: hypothetical protein ABJA98_24795, partial [Acidobacteriota bacterium]